VRCATPGNVNLDVSFSPMFISKSTDIYASYQRLNVKKIIHVYRPEKLKRFEQNITHYQKKTEFLQQNMSY
jgi:hypothetical protein